MKKRTIDILILLAYAVPWVFLGMYGDYSFSGMWPYALSLGVMLGLGWYCGKTKRIPLAMLGNLLSLLTSCLCTCCFATEQWNYFFKAFPTMIRTVQFSALYFVPQLIPWWLRKVTE